MQDKLEASIKPGLIIGISLILGFVFDLFFYEKIPGVSFPLYIILILSGLFLSVKVFKKHPAKDVFWLLLPLIFFSSMVFFRASILLTFLNIVLSLFLLLVIADVFWNGKLRSFLISDYIRIFFLPLMFLRPLFQTFGDLLSWKKAEENQKIFSQVVRGIIITAPFLIIFVVLFSSADLIFQKYISNIINLDIEPETIFRSLLVLAVTLVFIGAYSFILRNSENSAGRRQVGEGYTLGVIESNILLSSVNFLFLIFIILQLTYLFGGESNISSQGFTYAEYARRGFFELIAVAILSLLLLLAVDKYIIRKEEEHSLTFKILSTSLIAQVILVMSSAYMRLALYEDAYGFTTLRLYSHAFIILLAVIFGLLVYKIYRDVRENSFAARAFIAVMLFLAAMNIMNPDAFIARRNIERFQFSGDLDVFYLAGLSDDAAKESAGALNISDENLRNNFARELYWRHQNRKGSPYFTSWQSFNLSRWNADRLFRELLL